MKTTALNYGLISIVATLGLSACVGAAPAADQDENFGQVQEEFVELCGGFTGAICPSGYTCVDDPSDSCDPDQGGGDCGGVCVKDKKKHDKKDKKK